MSAPTADALTETLTHACSIAEPLAGDWSLVWYDATYPSGRNPDRPTRVHPRPTADNPDAVPGDTWDPGVGDHAAKEACRHAADLTVTAHRLAGQALCKLVDLDDPSLRSRAPRTAVDFRRLVMRTKGRLHHLVGHGVAQAGDETRALAHSAASALIEAHAAVKGRMRDFDHVGELPVDRRCWNCQRPATYVKTMECEACSKYRRRMEAQIRAGRTPTHRYRPVPRFEEAHRARQRREERLKPGQLDIEGPLPGGSYREGEWASATPLPDIDKRPKRARKEAS